MRIRAALLAGTILGLCASGGAQAKWRCPYTDMVSISYYCYGINPVPINDIIERADAKEVEKKEKEEAKKAEENATAKKKTEEAVGKQGSQGEKSAATPSPPPKNTLGELVFGPHDQTKDIKLQSTQESEFQKVSLAFSNSIIEATVMALAAKRKTEEDSKEVAKLIQEAQQSETVRQDLAFNNKVKNKLVELQALKQALIAKNVEIEARKQKVLETSDQTVDQGNKKPSGSSDTPLIQLNDPAAFIQAAKDEAERESIADYFKFFGQDFQDTPPLTAEEQKQADIDQLSLSFQQSMGMSKEQADQLARQVAGEMDQSQGSQEDKARQQALKMQQDPGKYGLTKEQAEQAAKDSKTYGDPNAPGRKTQVTAENAKSFTGRYIGVNQECASLTKAFAPGVGPASSWKPGQKLGPDTPLAVGTPVATFNNGAYGPPGSPGGKSGYSHTGIYIGQNSEGFQILDQYNGSGGAKITTIPWSKGGFQGADKYHAIK